VAGGGSLGPPTLIDGFANGWLIHPPPGKAMVVSFSWTPQRGVDIALVVSAIGLVACLFLAFWPRRRSRRADAAGSGESAASGGACPGRLSAPWAPRARLGVGPSIVFTVVAGGASALLISPVAGFVVAVVAGASCTVRWGRALLAGSSVLLLAGGGLAELTSQLHHHFPLVLEWPQHFEGAGRAAWLAVALLAADAMADQLRAWPEGKRGTFDP
jgi:arabinofuranan 3-O-arabinosyltransferase